MSGFYATSGRIRVVDTVSGVDEEVFDTDNDMPHIIGEAYVSDQSVEFTTLTQSKNYAGFDNCLYTVLVPTWFYEYQYVSGYYDSVLVWYPSSWDVYSWYPMERVYTPGGIGYETVWVPGYSELVRASGFDYECVAAKFYTYGVDASEYAKTVNIANLPVDEDGNAVDVDFVIVQATGSRSTAGKDPRFNQALPTSVPGKTFSFQGSVLLESSGRASGDSWLRRIISIFPSGGKLKLKIQESTSQLNRAVNDEGFPHISESKSTYNFNFKVFFGRFKS
jgi:hypothetical protein